MSVALLSQWITDYQPQPHLLSGAYQQLMANISRQDNAWIYIASEQQINEQIKALLQVIQTGEKTPADFPLFGVPFAVKDNIDVAGMPTSAACPVFTYHPADDATVIARLRAAGAIVVGKTNLDQFATGLVGTRSPYGAVVNSFNPDYVSGGSSSGSASVVARGLVGFSLGTDTAGSGRVPAGFNNIVGLKPTKGWLSTAGVVPACRLNDCVSIFAHSAADAALVANVAGGFDPLDPYSRSNPKHRPGSL
ncbi:Glutamyl-tRNA(Gln) amidotransferase subunit A [Cedecea neteri]|uniref:Glutamyl-tRNA(Gln) amidotransferase subunit A n=1 Tax=Cedecea neteri TaxID=158822 RepID=A0A2X3J0G7_9ENTR|nr:Glutamyl-tRNA(Gln) amidotransferase subunit A [Cedecea neteri]